ncbi:MAG: LamG-like jellyroll fold domain-containing protein, partial [Casimicrobium sp.]
ARSEDCLTWADGWIYFGHILIDQDIAFGRASGGADWGVSVGSNRIAWGVNPANGGGLTVCSNAGVLNNQWRHVALQRRINDGRLWVFVDGELEATVLGGAGDLSYPLNFQTNGPDSDPFTVFGAEKIGYFDWPNYTGLLAEVRFSTTLRYPTGTTLGPAFTRPNARFVPDAQTASLWHFNEGSGSVVGDSAGNSDGQVVFTQDSTKPAWSTDSPFSPSATPCALDVDGNGSATAANDGVLILRRLLGLSGNALIDGARAANATRDAAQIAQYIAGLDLNADGNAPAVSSAMTDGLLIYRALAGRDGNALIANVRASTGRDATQILDWIRTTHGVSCIP